MYNQRQKQGSCVLVIKHPQHAQNPTEADRIYQGGEKGKVSTSL